ncbi:unnamed protein product [Phytophthora fragariaefolia]|uniref:Unnamed protein product n=1 Tax=Phytophthora fragariaefolia TaxID=1490495 RepID=A0A9W6XIQ3_9STRA|nr:unnamed protein product [Phytophthora fragariaefolia]
MVPRPGSATPEDGVTIKQESGVVAPSIGRSSTASEQQRPDASWSSEGTFTTGRVRPVGLKPEKAENQNPPTTKAAVKRKSKKKKKLRAPESATEKLSKTGGTNAGLQYTAEELDYALCKTQLSRLLKRDPILSFLRPNLISELTRTIQEPAWKSITDVRMTVHAPFGTLQEAGFVMVAFKVFDWELVSWKDLIKATTGPLTGLSSVGSDSSVESPKRMPMSGRLPRIMPLTAAPERTETPSPEENAISRALKDAITRLMQSMTMRTTDTPARSGLVPTVETTLPATTLREPADVAMESVSSQSTPRSKCHTRDLDEDPEDLVDPKTGPPGTAAAVATATTGTGLIRVRLSAFSKLKELHGRDASEEKARAWLNGVKSASRRDGITGEEECALFRDPMTGPARQCRHYHASKHPDETPLEYLYQLNVAAMRAKIPYADGTAEEKREHMELFINTLGFPEQELASRLTLMETPDAPALEKKLRAQQRGLVHQKKALFGSSKFRQKAPAPPAPAPRAVHAIHTTADGYDTGHESCDSEYLMYDQDRDEDDRAKMCMAGQTPPGEPARREAGSDDAGRGRPRRRHCNSRRHSDGDYWSLLTCQKCSGRHPTDRCLRICKAGGELHDIGECPMEEFFNQLSQRNDPKKHAGMLPSTAEKMLNSIDRWAGNQYETSDPFSLCICCSGATHSGNLHISATCSVVTIHSRKHYYWQKATYICQYGACIRTEILPTTRWQILSL